MISIPILVLLVFFTLYKVAKDQPMFQAILINNDIESIYEKFKEIDDICGIIAITSKRSRVNFLNVKSFEGSQVGSLNLAHPKRWRGPYLRSNPDFKGIVYEVLKTYQGYFIVPGVGVVLPNKLVIGKDLILDFKSDIASMMQKGGPLQFNGKPLAKKLDFNIGDWTTVKDSKKRLLRIDSTLREMNEALPFTQNKNIDMSLPKQL
jgi:hypothetical protein